MKSAVIVFPGINRERDMARALKLVSGREPALLWHADTALPPGTDLVVIPGALTPSEKEGGPPEYRTFLLPKADYRIEYGRVMSAMVILQRAGARKVGFVSDPLPERKSRS